MKSSMDHIIHAATRKPTDELNLLYLPYDGFFEWMISNVVAKFYCSNNSLVYQWPCNNWPKTLNILPGDIKYIPNRVDLDVVIANSRKSQAFPAQNMSNYFHMPLVIVDHEIPAGTANTNLRKYVNSRMPENAVYVATHDLILDEWYYNEGMEVHKINYGFKPDNSSIKHNEVLVVGDYDSGDGILVKEMMGVHPKVVGLGYNGNTKHYSSLLEIEKTMASSRICITASQSTRPPILAMMAAANNCAVITNKTKWTETIFENGDNAMLFDSVHQIKKLAKELLSNDTLTDDIANRSFSMIMQEYNIADFTKQWTDLLHKLSTRVFVK